MTLYNIFSYNVEIQYKGYFLSKAMMFTLVTTFLTVVIPFFIAFRSRGIWLKSHYFYEQPVVQFTYEYLLVIETEDPSEPLVCSNKVIDVEEEHCLNIRVHSFDDNGDRKNDLLYFKFDLNTPPNKTIKSIILLLALDFQLMTVCPFQMQSLVAINKEFAASPSAFVFYGDIQLHQSMQLFCGKQIDSKYNTTLFKYLKDHDNIVDNILQESFRREINTQVKEIHSRSQFGHTGIFTLNVHLKVPEMMIRFTPNILQELKWVWPQYLSFGLVFYWIFNKIKKFVFQNRLFMAWKIEPKQH